MTNKHLNIIDLGTTGSGWQTTTPINDTHIAKIKDRSAKTSNSLNAIPSPFSRLHVFETAFKLVTEDIKDHADRTATVYKELVSDCLDALELLFNKKYHESQGDVVEIAVWRKAQNLEALNKSVYKEHQILARTLEMYLSQDFHEDFNEIFIVKYQGIVIAGTSPLSLLFTSPGLDKIDGVFRDSKLKNEFHLINPNTGYKYFSRVTAFEKRNDAFKNYLVDTFNENPKLKDSAEAFWNCINEFSLPKTFLKRPVLEVIQTPDAGIINVLGVELKQNNDENSLDIFNNHIVKVPYRINKEKFFTPTYLNDRAEREFDFLLPIKPEFLSRISLHDIPRLITYETTGESRLKVTVKSSDVSNKPWEKTYMANHSDKRDGELIDYSNSLSFKFTIGIFPFLKVVEINKDDSRVNVKRYDRTKYENNNGKASIYFQVNNSCFDVIQIQLPTSSKIQSPSGFIVPAWNEKVIKPKRFDFSVDFGTTNTFIAYTDDGTHSTRPKAFDITSNDMQMVMLSQPGDKRNSSINQRFKVGNVAQIVSEVVQHEFLPSIIMNEEDDVFRIPFRTAVFEKQNLSESEYSLLDNITKYFIG